jgi:hypothetical protein
MQCNKTQSHGVQARISDATHCMLPAMALPWDGTLNWVSMHVFLLECCC